MSIGLPHKQGQQLLSFIFDAHTPYEGVFMLYVKYGQGHDPVSYLRKSK